MKIIMWAIAAVVGLASAVSAHPGGLNAQGCHNDRKNGGYHCHRDTSRAPAQNPAPAPQRLTGGDAYYANCDAARAAGVTPLRRGDPGYRAGLDRDGDGKACE